MKQFIVNRHTDPSNPTLDEVPTEKVPVYDTEADAVADLSNLEENQIGFIKDTGNELSQPIDTVESGNLHAVTSNAVAKSLSYSTTEQATGGKWIDGKPIYRKVIEINSVTASASSQGFSHGVTGLEKIITLYGNCVISNRERMFPYFDNENRCFVVYYDSTNIQMFFGYSATNLKIVIEYTKA